MRSLIFFIIVIVVFLFVLVIWQRIQTMQMIRRREEEAENQENPKEEPMNQCALCGVHVPHHEAVITEKGTFCSQEHAQRYSEGD